MNSNPQYPRYIKTEYETFWKALETDMFIYYSRYKDDDALMYRKEQFELVSDNYMAINDMFEVIIDNKYTWLSKTMRYNVKELQKQILRDSNELD